ncbi:MAG: hypothetical protein ACOYLO_09770 [Ferruginibacter sp.]
MKKKRFIKQLLSLALLLLFAFSITPRKTLHEVFGCHKYTSGKTDAKGNVQISLNGFHCFCNQPDLHSPFIETPFFSTVSLNDFIAHPVSFYSASAHTTPIPFLSLRGPPAFV